MFGNDNGNGRSHDRQHNEEKAAKHGITLQEWEKDDEFWVDERIAQRARNKEAREADSKLDK